MSKTLVASFVACGLLVGASSRGADQPVDGAAAFARLKALAGNWEGHGDSPTGFPMKIEYRVTGGGSTVTERLFVGQPHEMFTVYYMDGHDLVLTHYCAGANQPHMRLASGGAEGALRFDFVSGTNLDPEKSSFMHGAQFTTLTKDRLEATWSSFDKGKPSDSHTFYMSRAAAPAAQ